MKHGTYHFDAGSAAPVARPAFARPNPENESLVDLHHTAEDTAPFATRVPVSAGKQSGTWTPDEPESVLSSGEDLRKQAEKEKALEKASNDATDAAAAAATARAEADAAKAELAALRAEMTASVSNPSQETAPGADETHNFDEAGSTLAPATDSTHPQTKEEVEPRADVPGLADAPGSPSSPPSLTGKRKSSSS